MEGDRQRGRAGGLTDLARDRLARLELAARHHDGRARASESERHASADPPAAAGHDRNATGEVEQLLYPHGAPSSRTKVKARPRLDGIRKVISAVTGGARRECRRWAHRRPATRGGEA